MPYIATIVAKSSTMSNKQLIYIAGPTAVGKTALSIALAKHLNTEIISCDSRQCYKEMFIGTAAPTISEQQGIPHHFIQNKSIHRHFNAGNFQKEGLVLLEQLFKKHKIILVVGGSGLFAKALMEGMDEFPLVDQRSIDVISRLYKKKGLRGLQKALAKRDPDYYKTVDHMNPRRLIRALEICETSQKPYSTFLGKSTKIRSFSCKTLLLNLPREILYQRINQRVEEMVEAGLEKEAKKLYPYKNLAATQSLGYQEWFDHFDGKFTKEEAILKIQKNTRRYAKRQITWFKKMDSQSLIIGELNQTLDQAIRKIEF